MFTKGGAVRKILVRFRGNVPTGGAKGLFCPRMRKDFTPQEWKEHGAARNKTVIINLACCAC